MPGTYFSTLLTLQKLPMDIYQSFTSPTPPQRRSRSVPKGKYSFFHFGDEKWIDSVKRLGPRESSRNTITNESSSKHHSERLAKRDSIKTNRCMHLIDPDDESIQCLLNHNPKAKSNRKHKNLGRNASLSPYREFSFAKEDSTLNSNKVQSKRTSMPFNAIESGKISMSTFVKSRMDDETVASIWSSKQSSKMLNLPSEYSDSLHEKLDDAKYASHSKLHESRIKYLQLRFQGDTAIVDYLTAPSPETTTQYYSKNDLFKTDRKKERSHGRDRKRDKVISVMNSAA
jgi:hypothetical protein